MEEEKKEQQVPSIRVAETLIKKRAIITSGGQVIREDEEHPNVYSYFKKR
jgi:hypothetical protein